MKKHFLKLLVVSAATLCIATWAFADGSTANTTAGISGQIIKPITISKTVDLAFGKNISDATSIGTVIIATDGTRTFGGAVVGQTAQFGAAGNTAASFGITGENNATYAITLPSSPVTVTSAALDTMSVDSFVSNPNATGTLSGTGSDTLLVGATLHVGINQAAGVYTALTPFSVTVAYN